MSSDAPAPRSRAGRPEWVWGGALLLASAVLPLFQAQFAGVGALHTALLFAMYGAFAVAIGLFALGRDSVVARRPLGVTALLVLGLWPFATAVFWSVIPVEAIAYDPALIAIVSISGYLQMIVPLAAAVVAAVQIARAGVVPRRLRWLPLIAVAVGYGAGILVTLVYVPFEGATLSATMQALVGPLSAMASLASFAAVAGIGILAIVEGLRPRPAPTPPAQVYPSAVPPAS